MGDDFNDMKHANQEHIKVLANIQCHWMILTKMVGNTSTPCQHENDFSANYQECCQWTVDALAMLLKCTLN